MKKMVVSVCAALCLLSGVRTEARANEIDVLVDKLVQKKVLTPNEGKIILEETKIEVNKQNAEAKNDMIPKWVQTFKWNGDFRLRNEWRQNPGIVPNLAGDNRLRFRARVGFTTDINKETLFGFRLASGSATDSTSTNQTMGTMFTSKYIGIDRAYIEYRPTWLAKNLKLIGGKMPNPLWVTDMIWDEDVNPEGIALQYEYPLMKDLNLFANLGGFVYNDLFGTTYTNSTIVPAETSAAYIVEPQIGLDYKLQENLSLKGALAYMNVSNLANHPVMNAQGGGPRGNSIYYKIPVADSNPYYKYGFDIINPRIQLSTKVFDVPLKFIGDYAHNFQAPNHNDAWQLGSILGEGKKAREWEIGYFFRRVEKDSIMGELSDSDFGYGVYSTLTSNTAYSGGTDHFGHILKLKYNITDNWSVGGRFTLAWNLGVNNVYRDQSGSRNMTVANQPDSHKAVGGILLDTIWKF